MGGFFMRAWYDSGMVTLIYEVNGKREKDECETQQEAEKRAMRHMGFHGTDKFKFVAIVESDSGREIVGFAEFYDPGRT
ncbi:MAG: hypothetical protein ABSH22_15060 [Tepidisphaeraceae bacterium]